VRAVDAVARRVVGPEQRGVDASLIDLLAQPLEAGDRERLVGRGVCAGAADSAVVLVLELLQDRDLLRTGRDEHVPCSAAGMFHSSSWKISVPGSSYKRPRCPG